MQEFEGQKAGQGNSRWDRWLVMGVIVLLLGAVAVPQAFRRHGGTNSTPANAASPAFRHKPSAAGEFRGLTLQLHSSDPKIPFERYVEEIARTGANAICLSLAAYQENCSSSSLFLEYRKVPTDERLRKLIRLARRLGLRVILMPIVLLENPRAGEWRGKIDPPRLDDWWEDYENIILRYARIAEETQAEMLMIGSELVLMEKYTDRWRSLIRKVRRAYRGKLSYSANWDHYKDIQWWRDLDLVGMTVYYDLVGEKKPTLEVLLDAWRPIKKEILAWREKIGRPIVFTEVGWPSQVGCAKEPWNYYASTTPDPVTQDLCFKAFFKTWAGEKHVAGVLIWEWRNHPGQTGGLKDISYIPIGKPAMKTIQEYFRSPATLPRTTTAPTAAKPTSSAGNGS